MKNNFSKKTIENILKKLDIKKNDDVMIHGDAGIIHQYDINIKKGFNLLFNTIEKFIGKKGTILIPHFSYSFCKKKKFYKNSNKSELGIFNKMFTERKNFKRTSHPIFSFLIKGKNWNYYNNSKLNICFGKSSIFDLFHKKNGKIVVLGNAFEQSATFLHHIEDVAKVNYRFYKSFSGFIIDKKIKKFITVSYYVRKLNCKSKLKFKKSLHKILKKTNVGRFQVYSISSSKLYNHCMIKLKNNKNYLIN